MNRKLVFIIVVLAAVSAYFVYDLLIPSPKVLRGTFFVSDAGESHGGFEYTAEWYATLEVRGTTGALKLVLRVGLGDALEKHGYRVTGFKKTPRDDQHAPGWESRGARMDRGRPDLEPHI